MIILFRLIGWLILILDVLFNKQETLYISNKMLILITNAVSVILNGQKFKSATTRELVRFKLC